MAEISIVQKQTYKVIGTDNSCVRCDERIWHIWATYKLAVGFGLGERERERARVGIFMDGLNQWVKGHILYWAQEAFKSYDSAGFPAPV